MTAPRPLIETLRLMREAKHMSQPDVAGVAGFSLSVIQDAERGHGFPSLPGFCDWCEALGIDIILRTKSDK